MTGRGPDLLSVCDALTQALPDRGLGWAPQGRRKSWTVFVLGEASGLWRMQTPDAEAQIAQQLKDAAFRVGVGGARVRVRGRRASHAGRRTSHAGRHTELLTFPCCVRTLFSFSSFVLVN